MPSQLAGGRRAPAMSGDVELAIRLYELRLRAVYSVAEVARATRYSPSYYSAVENARVMPSLRFLVRLAALYGSSLDNLAGHLVEAETETDDG